MALLPLSQRLDQFKKLASDVEQGSKKAKTFKTGTRRIARFTRRISDLIAMYSELGEWSVNREKESLQVLYEAVEEAKELISSCSHHYSIIGSLNTNELKEEFSEWGKSVAQALIGFADGEEFGDVELEMEFQMEISALAEHMSGAKFVDKEMTTQCVLAQSLLDLLTSLSQSPSYSTLTKLIDDVINDSNFDLVDLSEFEKLYTSKPEWLENSGLKEEYLALLHMMITKAMSKKRGFQSLLKDPVPEVPASFKCPISKEIMKDPVVASGNLFCEQTGHIYDRESITNRMKNGNYTCPITGKPLSCMRLISLPALKKDIDDFVKKHGITVPATTGPQNAADGGSGPATSSIFGPTSGGLFSPPSGLPRAVFQNTTFPAFPPASNWLSTIPTLNFQASRPVSTSTPTTRECYMSIISEKEFQHLDMDQLRHYDYAQRGFNGLTIEALQSQINQITMDEHSKNFSNGVQFPPQPASGFQPPQASQFLFGASAPIFGGQTAGVDSFGQGFGADQASAFPQSVPTAVPQFGTDAANQPPPSSAPQ